jgi:hypothetical protein
MRASGMHGALCKHAFCWSGGRCWLAAFVVTTCPHTGIHAWLVADASTRYRILTSGIPTTLAHSCSLTGAVLLAVLSATAATPCTTHTDCTSREYCATGVSTSAVSLLCIAPSALRTHPQCILKLRAVCSAQRSSVSILLSSHCQVELPSQCHA